MPHGTFNAESTFSIVFTLEGSRHNDGLYGTRFEYRQGQEIFSSLKPSIPALGDHSASCSMGTGILSQG